MEGKRSKKRPFGEEDRLEIASKRWILDGKRRPPPSFQAFGTVNAVLVFLFVTETALKLYAMGCMEFWRGEEYAPRPLKAYLKSSLKASKGLGAGVERLRLQHRLALGGGDHHRLARAGRERLRGRLQQLPGHAGLEAGEDLTRLPHHPALQAEERKR